MAEIIQINENTWRFEDEFVRFFLLVGSEKAMLVDSGVNSPDAVDLAKTLTDKPIILLNTHSDMDHVSGTAKFEEIYMHEQDYARIKDSFPNTALVELQDNQVIDLGNRPLKIVHIPGHTRGSVAILDVNNRVLLAGDSVQKGEIYMFGPHRDVNSYESSLDRLISMIDEYDSIYASHADYLLPNDYAMKVKDAWKQVQSGQVDFVETDLYGNKVKLYTTSVCGFFMQ